MLVLMFTMLAPVAKTKAAGLKLNKSKVTLHVGNDFALEITEGYEAQEDDLWWWYWDMPSYSSSDTSVAIVDYAGNVHAMGVGTATITVSYDGMQATCKVKVLANSSTLSADELLLYERDETEIKITYKKKKAESYDYRVYDAATMERIYYGLNLTHVKNGKFTVQAERAGNYLLELIVNATDGKGYSSFCLVVVDKVGLLVSDVTLALGTTYQIETVNVTDVEYEMADSEWDTEGATVATVSPDGLVEAVAEGFDELVVSYTNPHGERIERYLEVCVTNPQLVPAQKSLWLNEWYSPEITGTYYTSDMVITSSDESVVSAGAYGCYAVGAGTATLTYLVDGRELTEQVRVIDPKLSQEYALMKKQEKLTLTVTGAEEGCKITYKSSDTSVASVTQKGKITAKKNGTAVITVTIDGVELYCTLTVTSGKGFNAVREGEKVLGAPYSQEKRMKEGYYDCSSFVWRMYKAAGYNLAGVKSYAPTAADLAKKLEEQGKAIAYEYVPASELKPGDIIFYSTGANNGRYKNIDHVAMFYGHYMAYDSWYGEAGEFFDYGLVIHASGNVHIKCYEGYRNWGIVMIARPYGK